MGNVQAPRVTWSVLGLFQCRRLCDYRWVFYRKISLWSQEECFQTSKASNAWLPNPKEYPKPPIAPSFPCRKWGVSPVWSYGPLSNFRAPKISHWTHGAMGRKIGHCPTSKPRGPNLPLLPQVCEVPQRPGQLPRCAKWDGRMVTCGHFPFFMWAVFHFSM